MKRSDVFFDDDDKKTRSTQTLRRMVFPVISQEAFRGLSGRSAENAFEREGVIVDRSRFLGGIHSGSCGVWSALSYD